MDKNFYINNRKKYIDTIKDHSATILYSGRLIQKSADQDYPFEVNKNFYYLTGINQAEVILLLVKGETLTKEYLFVEKNDELYTKWVGMKLTLEEAKEISGIEEVFFVDKFEEFVFAVLNNTRKVQENINTIYLDLELRHSVGYSTLALEFQKKYLFQYYPHLKIENAYQNIIGLRMIKTPEEIKKIKESISITKIALENILKYIKPGLYEYQIESFFDTSIKYHGNRDPAFDTICAAGKNATVLHYIDNNSLAKDGDLMLFDLGCRTNFYASDISRTYPVNKKFTQQQRQIYQLVLDTNKKCIEYLKPGVTWESFNQYASTLLTAGLKKLGLIKEDKELSKYYYHSIGHMLGLDTHDPVLRNKPFEEGMVLTVEPGIYIEELGIGIRIEDDVLITKDGALNLSADIIKEINDIEKFMNEN